MRKTLVICPTVGVLYATSAHNSESRVGVYRPRYRHEHSHAYEEDPKRLTVLFICTCMELL